jgi:voltage-gated potassium channel
MKTRDSATYQLIMLVLCLFALGSLAMQATVAMNPEVRMLLDYADYTVCFLFFTDFLLSLWQAPNRLRYLATWGWLDLLSSIPTFDAGRWGRMGRIVRVFRVLRGLRAAKILATVVLERRAQNTFVAAAVIALLILFSCSIAVLEFEARADGNIKTAEDAFWWAAATITTVGYGDRYPVTSEGRLVAVILMCVGVGLFGTFSGLLAAWFIAPAESATDREIAELRREVRELRSAMDSAGRDAAVDRS